MPIISTIAASFRKWLITVPVINGQTNTNAAAALIAKGFAVGTVTAETTANAGINQQVKAGTIVPSEGTQQPYNTSVSYIYYNYVAPPFFPPDFTPTPPHFPPAPPPPPPVPCVDCECYYDPTYGAFFCY
jgi:beta-lactam-binding protein with PASTA domain